MAVHCCSSQRKRSPTCPFCWAAVSLSLRSTRYPYSSYISSSLFIHLLVLTLRSPHLLPILTSSHSYAYIVVICLLSYPYISSFRLFHLLIRIFSILTSPDLIISFHLFITPIISTSIYLVSLSDRHLNAHTRYPFNNHVTLFYINNFTD